ncbi:hypothetical protein BKA93DRAFT_793018 [Sparassis latifolia]
MPHDRPRHTKLATTIYRIPLPLPPSHRRALCTAPYPIASSGPALARIAFAFILPVAFNVEVPLDPTAPLRTFIAPPAPLAISTPYPYSIFRRGPRLPCPCSHDIFSLYTIWLASAGHGHTTRVERRVRCTMSTYAILWPSTAVRNMRPSACSFPSFLYFLSARLGSGLEVVYVDILP